MRCQRVQGVSPLSAGFQSYEMPQSAACHPCGPVPPSTRHSNFSPCVAPTSLQQSFKNIYPCPSPPSPSWLLLVPSAKRGRGEPYILPVFSRCGFPHWSLESSSLPGSSKREGRQSSDRMKSPLFSSQGRVGVCLERGQEPTAHPKPHIPDISSRQPRFQRQVSTAH